MSQFIMINARFKDSSEIHRTLLNLDQIVYIRKTCDDKVYVITTTEGIFNPMFVDAMEADRIMRNLGYSVLDFFN